MRTADNKRIEAAHDNFSRACREETEAGRAHVGTAATFVAVEDGVLVQTFGCHCDGCLAAIETAFTHWVSEQKTRGAAKHAVH